MRLSYCQYILVAKIAVSHISGQVGRYPVSDYRIVSTVMAKSAVMLID